jgi:Leucine-rich repeat (LRR) protein
MRSAYLKLGSVRALNLSNNRLTKVYGLGRLYSLEKLDISSNKIELLSDISGIAKLPNLTEIVTNGNPVAEVGTS